VKKKIWLISLVLLLAVSIVYTGCAAPAPVEEEKGPIKIGVLAPLSGGFASFGSRLKAALEIHVEDINAEGGLLERPVELTFRDTKFNPEAALREARDLIEGQNCDFLIGCVNSSCSLVVSEYVKTLNGRTLQIVGTSTFRRWERTLP